MTSKLFPSELFAYQIEEFQHLNLQFDNPYPHSLINQENRTDYNDLLVHIRNDKRMVGSKERTFEQKYRLEFYQGSSYVGESGFSDPVTNQTDITIISQTSYLINLYLELDPNVFFIFQCF